MADKQNISGDEAAVRDLIEAWAGAVQRKDYDGIVRSHAADFVMFDVPPPFKSVGLDAYRKTWDLFFSCSGDPVCFRFKKWTSRLGPMSPSLLRLCAAAHLDRTASRSRSIFA